MKKLTTLASAVALATAAALPAQAEVSANVGVVSDYYFRGANLGDAGVYAGLDYESGGFYAGTWWIDDQTGGNDGMENDWYLGYGGGDDSFTWGIGYNNYQYTYTGAFEHEIVASFGFGPVSIELVKGIDDDEEASFDDSGTLLREDEEDYTVATLGLGFGAFSGTVGYYELDDVDDSDYQWLELGWSGEIVEGIDAGITIGKQFSSGNDTDGYMFLDVSKSFDL